MKLFLAGATGVIGRRVVPRLVAAGYEVTAIARRPEAASQLEKQGARPVEASLFDPDGLRAAVAGHEAVVNLATKIPAGAAAALPSAWSENARIRTEGARNLVDAALHAGAVRLVQESIVFLYADGGSEWLGEDAAVDEGRATAPALKAERQAQRFTETGGVGVALRFATFHATDASHTIDTVKLLRRGLAAATGKAEAYLPSIMADDAASAVLAAMAAPAGLYNVGDDEPLTRQEYARAAAEAFGLPMPRLQPAVLGKIPGLEILARSRRVSAERFKQTTGWKPATPSMREGWRDLARTMDGSTVG